MPDILKAIFLGGFLLIAIALFVAASVLLWVSFKSW